MISLDRVFVSPALSLILLTIVHNSGAISKMDATKFQILSIAI